MKHIFLDTNVVIDLLANRQPYSIDAARLFDLALGGQAIIYISTISYNNIYYLLRKSLSNSAAIKLLEELSGMMEIIDLTDKVLKQSLKTYFKDYEDAIQYYCALSVPEIDFIVTRNTKDYKKSSLSVLTPSEAIVAIMH